jgi:hypothetical protein
MLDPTTGAGRDPVTKRQFELDDFMDRAPVPRLLAWFLIPFVTAAVIWQVVDPVPGYLLGRHLVLGAVVGALWIRRVLPLTLIGFVLLLVAHPQIVAWGRLHASTNGLSWDDGWSFQSMFLTWAVVVFVAAAPHLIRRRLRPDPT